ncbi:MAG: hypothetical protein DRI48_05250 [Chloroflexi bacterium]|nr:MAG: hypothetical protein DRI48_05250 [Chloroflexota bacterium]
MKRSRRRKPSSLPPVEYPIGTVAYYGPDDRTVTKIAAGVIESEDAEPIMKRWRGSDVATSSQVQKEIQEFFEAHKVQHVAVVDGVLGCPHEEGVDFPVGQECPYCPFWRGKQGIQVVPEQASAPGTGVSESSDFSALQKQLRGLTRARLCGIWKRAQADTSFLDSEETQIAQIMQEHSEYHDLWGRLDTISEAELERDGTNPIVHITIHDTIENQIAQGDLPEVRLIVERLMARGISRHEAIHRVGSVLIEEIYHVLREDCPFDEAGYLRKLRRLVRSR